MTSPFIPSSFTYGDAPNGGQVMPMIVAGRNPSNTIDVNYPSGYWWLSDIFQGGSGGMYYQGGNTAGTPAWTLASSVAGALNTLSDGSTTVTASGGNIALEGSPNQITVTGSDPSHNLVFSFPSNMIAPASFRTTTTLTAGSTLTVTDSATIGNDLTVVDDATIGGDLTVVGAITLGALTVAGTILLNTTGNADTTIGNPAGTGAILIETPSGDFTLNGNANEIHIGDDAAANVIVMGSQTGAASLHLQAGTGDVLIDGAVATAITIGKAAQTGTITLGLSTAGQNITVGSGINVGAQTISIANGASAANSTINILSGTGTAGTATLALGNNPRVTVAGLADVAPVASRTTTIGGGTITTAITDTIDIGPDGATTNAAAVKTVNVNTGALTLGSILTNIAIGAVTSGTHTTSISSGNVAAGTVAVNILTGTGTKTLNVGNSDGLTISTFLGPHNINASQNNNTAINSGTSTGTVTVGNAAAGAVTVDTAAGISLDAATASNFTVTGAAVDLTLSSSGGSVNITATEAAADAIVINASNAAGGIDILTGGGQIDIGSNAVAQTANFNIGAAAKTTVIGSVNTTSTTTVQSGTGGVVLDSGATTRGLIEVTPSTDTQASPTAASTINSRVGSVIFTGFTTAAAGAQVWTITNSLVTTASAIFVSAANLGANDAQMTVTRVLPAAGTFDVTTQNLGAAALNGDVIVNFWVIN